MIEVSLSPQCMQLMELLELSADVANQTVNERDKAFIDKGVSRMVACRWFSDERIVLVDGIISRKTAEPELKRVRIDDVTAQLVLELHPNLPAGRITREMDAEEILAVVAQSFGLPIKCAVDEPFSTLYSGPGSLATVVVDFGGRPREVCVIGSFQPDANYGELVWAFDVHRYREWFTMLLPGEKGLNGCGSITFWLQHPNVGWTTDGHRYTFPPFHGPVGITVNAIKEPDATVTLQVAGPYARQFTFRQPIPPCRPKGLFVVVTWDNGEITLHLNAKQVEIRRVG